MQKLIIACDDLFGLEVYSLIQEINNWHANRDQEPLYDVLGFISDSDDPFGAIDSPLPMICKMREWKPQEDVHVVLGMLDPKAKAAAVEVLRAQGAVFETIVCPWMLSWREWLTIGEGCIVCPYSAKPGMVIGDFVTVVSSMLSGHRIGDYSTVMRFTNLAGDCVGNYSFIGDHVFIPLGKNIGDNCRVDSGSIVARSVKDGVHVAGAPARAK